MPLYEYKCAKCANTLEVRHGFDERYGEPCPQCGGELNRVFNPAPIVFKGSGFYVTDSRSKSEPSSKPETPKETSPKESASKDSSKETKKNPGSKESAA